MRRLLVLLLVALTGCSSVLGDATRAVNAAGDFIEGAHAPLKDQHQRTELRCVETAQERSEAEACIEGVRDRYVPAWDAYDAAREAWLLAAAVIREAELLRQDVPANLVPALARLAGAVGRFREAIERARHPVQVLP